MNRRTLLRSLFQATAALAFTGAMRAFPLAEPERRSKKGFDPRYPYHTLFEIKSVSMWPISEGGRREYEAVSLDGQRLHFETSPEVPLMEPGEGVNVNWEKWTHYS